MDERAGEYLGVVQCEAHSLRAHRGNQVCRVSEEVEPAVAHRAEHHTAQWHDLFACNRSRSYRCAEPRFEFAPDTVVRPVVDGVGDGALEVDTAGVRPAGDLRGESP